MKAAWRVVKAEFNISKVNKTQEEQDITALDFCNYYTKQPETIMTTIPGPVQDPRRMIIKAKSVPNTIFLAPVTESEVRSVIKNLKTKSTTDVYGLSVKLF